MKKIYTQNTLLKTTKFLSVITLNFMLCLFSFNAKAQYCTPTYVHPCSSDGDIITHFQLGSISNVSTCSAGNYGDYTALPAASMFAGLSYTVAVTNEASGGEDMAFWIDYNNNFTFDANEKVAYSTADINANTTTVYTISIPYGAPVGTHRLRVRMVYSQNGSSIDPCDNQGYGETEDYLVTLSLLPGCTGNPVAGNATSTLPAVCGTSPFDLNLTGNTTGSSGITYQWQSSPNGTAWTNLGSAQLDPLRSGVSQLATTYYQCVVTCTSAALSSTSTPVTVVSTPLLNCYCIPAYNWDCSGDNFISFSLANLTAETPSCTPGSGFTDMSSVPSASINLNGGVTYTLTANTSYSGNGGAAAVGAWIDYDQNGVFDSNEFTYLGYGQPSYTVALAVPLTAPTGNVKMRLKMDANFAGSSTLLDPCNNNNGSDYGQIADYLVHITAATPCSAAPAGGNAAATSTLVCSATAYTVSLTNGAFASGLTYQWQQSPNGTAWSNIGTSSTYNYITVGTQSATTYYRCVTTCTGSSTTGTSTPVTVTQDQLVNCYCIPTYDLSCSGNNIVSFSLANLSAQTPSCTSTTAFTDLTGSVPANINLNAGVTYTLTVVTANNASSGDKGLGAWIDFNHNAQFDNSEYIYLGAGGAGTYTTALTVPLTTTSGAVRMRLKLEGSNVSGYININSCFNVNGSSDGQTVDYLVNLTAASACAAAPNAGTAISTSTTACLNASYDLDLTGSSVATGLMYQWQSSPNGSAWANIGASSPTTHYTIASQTATTYYRCLVTCTNVATTSTSTPVTVNLTPFINCYCTPNSGFSSNCLNDYISVFSVANVVGQTANCDTYGYSDSTASHYTVINLSAGNTYTLTANTVISGITGNGASGAWIDYNQSGTFDSNEFINLSFGPTGTYTNTFTVPVLTAGGAVKMRLKLDVWYADNTTIINACSNSNNGIGQILDYKVNITAAPLCSAAPVGGSATASDSTVCVGESFDLNLINNSIATGVSYQWQSSPNGTAWTNTGSASLTPAYTIGTQNATTYYRCVLTCTSSSATATSTSVMVLQNLFSTCYCTTDYISCSSSQFTDVTFASASTTGIACVNGYADMTSSASTATVTANQTYTLTTGMTSGLNSSLAGAWIDYNHNGIFETYEYTTVGSINVSGASTFTNTLTIPFTAMPGLTTMRLKLESDYDTPTSLDPCLAFETNGQTIDFSVFIIASPGCSGTPSAGTTVADVSSTCFGSPVNLSLSGNGQVSGNTYQWQYSLNNTTWTNLNISQTYIPYTVASQTVGTYYRCVVTCTSSTLSQTATPVHITQNAVNTCYCIPPPMDCTDGDEINRVVFATLTNTSTCSANGYADYTAGSPTPATTATITAGTAQSMTVTLGYSYGENITVWIDYDHNGVFDNSDYTFLGNSIGSGNNTISGNISVPATALTGLTRMRIRNRNGQPLTSTDACTSEGGSGARRLNAGSGPYGETEDYSVFILPSDCSGNNIPSGISVAASSPTVCPGGAVTLTVTGTIPAYTGLTYQWQQSPTGSGYTNTGTASANPSVTVFPTQNNYYICNILCHGSPAANTSTVYVTINTPVVTVTASAYTVCPAESVTLTAHGALTYTWTDGNATTPTTVYTPTITSVYPVKGMNADGCLGNGSILINVKPATNISGTITTAGTPVAGNAILYKYETYFTRFDSVTYQPITGAGGYNFPNINYGVYLIKAVPSSNTLQVTYGHSSVNWKTASVITHSCSIADTQNVNVISLTVLPPGPGTLSGVIYQGEGFGHKPSSPYSPLFPGQPIGGIVVKGGKNPGGSMFAQTITDGLGNYTLSGLPINTTADDDDYFILVDIPGLDTNHTYYRKITAVNNVFTHLDFEVDSAKINPVPEGSVGINTIANIDGGIKIYPNPANQKVTIAYTLTESSTVKIELYDLLGKSLKMITPSGEQSAGAHTYNVALSDLTAGMYFVKLRINNAETSVKLFVTN